MESIEHPVIEPTPTIETPPTAEVTPPVETPIVPETDFKSGGEILPPSDYNLVYYLTFALLISASAFSIYYHRQALDNLAKSNTSKLEQSVAEVRKNLKSLMGNKYESIN